MNNQTNINHHQQEDRHGTISYANNTLEHYGQWLLSIPRGDIPLLTHTSEYKSFVDAFRNLERAHRKAITRNQERAKSGERPVSFLQHMVLDEIVLRIFEFLPCVTLVQTSETCHRLHILSKRSAKQRTVHMEGHFYFRSEMKLLRAKEQIEGILPGRKPIVRIPLLGLQRRIRVSGCGDEEFNGIYFCTGSNGNGFLFSKPRDAEQWARQDRVAMELDDEGVLDRDVRIRNVHRNLVEQPRGADRREINDEGEDTPPILYPGRVPRCIIGKRFSNETILWYMSKEIIDETGKVKQSFSFWAKLMMMEEGTPDICQYPSQTSKLVRNGEPAWQSLSSTSATTPPTVELLD